ncbi:YycH family regulatory protein [Marinicrinis lubricantis]|uniref:YycH family regulatory protein n=1 Tax=Marinicrinis lubricantis TaxID=2086470 RepID=A0ABW1IRA1_9BACL
MLEKVKSLLLALLIAVSLWQTYMLAYSKPELERIDQNAFVDTELEGTKLEVTDLLFPKEIIIHLGDDRHTVLYPEEEFYKKIYEEKIVQRTFDGFRPLNWYSRDWDELRKTTRGIEIRFQDAIPISTLQNILQLRGDILFTEGSINRIWIMKENEEEVAAYFFTEQGLTVYEAGRADLQPTDVEQYVGFGEYLSTQNNYTSTDGTYYLPSQQLQTVKVRFDYSLYTPEQWKNSLFVDPSISRNFAEKDGTEIYTDGKRGLQVNHLEQWMSYSDPVAPVQEWTDVSSNLFSAVQFVNQHGGWNGSYMLEKYPDAWDQRFRFIQYYDGYPLISGTVRPFGSIYVTLQKSVISNYERSLIQLGEETMREEAVLPGGEELQAIVSGKEEELGESFMSVFPSYRPFVTDKYVELVPQWTGLTANGVYYGLAADE